VYAAAHPRPPESDFEIVAAPAAKDIGPARKREPAHFGALVAEVVPLGCRACVHGFTSSIL
jgi:hypothetical protein